jgi:hypothetical protein
VIASLFICFSIIVLNHFHFDTNYIANLSWHTPWHLVCVPFIDLNFVIHVNFPCFICTDVTIQVSSFTTVQHHTLTIGKLHSTSYTTSMKITGLTIWQATHQVLIQQGLLTHSMTSGMCAIYWPQLCNPRQFSMFYLYWRNHTGVHGRNIALVLYHRFNPILFLY